MVNGPDSLNKIGSSGQFSLEGVIPGMDAGAVLLLGSDVKLNQSLTLGKGGNGYNGGQGGAGSSKKVKATKRLSTNLPSLKLKAGTGGFVA
ncbi:MAG: hypothetical protein ACJATA_002120 [Sphingobacteriales bacterium]|jgi:hypothetical protein